VLIGAAPEKAGVGGSIPSLATILESISYIGFQETAIDLQEGNCYSADMPALNIRSLQAKTQTVSVYTRHTSDCSKKDDPH
jgi:hypothetical protein